MRLHLLRTIPYSFPHRGRRPMDHDEEGYSIDAFDFDVVCETFRRSVRELNLAEEHWVDHAKALLREFTDSAPDDDMISRIVGR
ncbi:hypothetical protein X749_28500 [Mesorhizobium sp. LNJC391B00]|nr:hypothetical protein X749_28500 [Mesorhizobium sp. LNJC391B00]